MRIPLMFHTFRSIILVLSMIGVTGFGMPLTFLVPVDIHAAPPDGYVADFVSTAATGVAMNDDGDITGTSYLDVGCGSFCLPPLETVVWRGGERIVLPDLPGLSGVYVNGINAQGWVSGYAGFPGTTTHAAVWMPSGNTYEIIDLGFLPGTSSSYAVGIDDLGRVVGWSTTISFPYSGAPFMWSESTGMVDLAAEGYPNEQPLAISPGGTVATQNTWYQLGDPSSVVMMPAPPSGFLVGTYPTAINNYGDQARFLVSTSGQNLLYLFRYHSDGTWQQISFTGQGHLSRYGVGSINDDGDVTATILSTGMIAYGPDGLTEPLAPLLSPAYQGSAVTDAGPMNAAGEILAHVMIGRSERLMRLTPADTCTNGCVRAENLVIRSRFIPDPNDPDHCYEGGIMFNAARVIVTVTNENGAPVRGAFVGGRFLDDYWVDDPVLGRTNAAGVVAFNYTGLCGVGAIAFLVDDVIKGNLVFDRTEGILTGWSIPQ